jgi:hypothetical protein
MFAIVEQAVFSTLCKYMSIKDEILHESIDQYNALNKAYLHLRLGIIPICIG